MAACVVTAAGGPRGSSLTLPFACCRLPHPTPVLQLVVIGHEMLADQLLKEVIKCAQLPVHKPYLATLCKLLPALHFNASQMDLIHDLRVLAEQAKAVLSDKGMVKDMEALREKLGTLDSSPVPTLSEEEIAVGGGGWMGWQACL